jgi:hypothetical protein
LVRDQAGSYSGPSWTQRYAGTSPCTRHTHARGVAKLSQQVPLVNQPNRIAASVRSGSEYRQLKISRRSAIPLTMIVIQAGKREANCQNPLRGVTLPPLLLILPFFVQSFRAESLPFPLSPTFWSCIHRNSVNRFQSTTFLWDLSRESAKGKLQTQGQESFVKLATMRHKLPEINDNITVTHEQQLLQKAHTILTLTPKLPFSLEVRRRLQRNLEHMEFGPHFLNFPWTITSSRLVDKLTQHCTIPVKLQGNAYQGAVHHINENMIAQIYGTRNMGDERPPENKKQHKRYFEGEKDSTDG